MIAVEKHEEVKRLVQQMRTQFPDWASFYREVLGANGILRQMFPGQRELAEFEQTDTYREIQRTLNELRERGPQPTEENDPTRVITVRLPKSLHESLRDEAFAYKTSINQLCISKLIQIIDAEKVPAETRPRPPRATTLTAKDALTQDTY